LILENYFFVLFYFFFAFFHFFKDFTRQIHNLPQNSLNFRQFFARNFAKIPKQNFRKIKIFVSKTLKEEIKGFV
jgi:hypothetical protein